MILFFFSLFCISRFEVITFYLGVHSSVILGFIIHYSHYFFIHIIIIIIVFFCNLGVCYSLFTLFLYKHLIIIIAFFGNLGFCYSLFTLFLNKHLIIILAFFCNLGICYSLFTLFPVSYTHLDVYKRQSLKKYYEAVSEG